MNASFDAGGPKSSQALKARHSAAQGGGRGAAGTLGFVVSFPRDLTPCLPWGGFLIPPALRVECSFWLLPPGLSPSPFRRIAFSRFHLRFQASAMTNRHRPRLFTLRMDDSISICPMRSREKPAFLTGFLLRRRIRACLLRRVPSGSSTYCQVRLRGPRSRWLKSARCALYPCPSAPSRCETL
jgi:hypothetical protein